jgi:hypothetical protein
MDKIAESERLAVSADKVQAERVVIWVGLVYFLVLAAVMTASISVAMYRGSVAASRALELRAQLIELPRNTMMYPLVWDGKTKRFANPNDGSVTVMDVSRRADRDKVFAMGNAALAGILAYNARGQDKPGEYMSLGYNQTEVDNNET